MSADTDLTATCRHCGRLKPMAQMYSVGSDNVCRLCALVAVLRVPLPKCELQTCKLAITDLIEKSSMGSPLSRPGWDVGFTDTLDGVRQVQEMHRQLRMNRDLVPYIGPGRLLERFLAGEIVTADEARQDESRYIARAIHGAQKRRLDYMLRER